METRELNIRCFGKNLGKIEVTEDPHQQEITLTLKIKPGPGLKLRTSTSGVGFAQFTFKEK